MGSPDINAGPVPGLLGDVAALHGRYYAELCGFPVFFEDKVAREMGEYLSRYDAAKVLVLWCGDHDRVTGSNTIDGSDPKLASGQAHLRWFILHDSLAGQGLGGRMMRQSLQFSRNASFSSVYLITLKGLGAAMSLYEKAVFKIVEEETEETWGGLFGTTARTRIIDRTFPMAESEVCPIYCRDALGLNLYERSKP